MVSIWLTLTLSLNLINGFCGLFSLGHQGFWAVGAYAAAVTVVYLPVGGWTALLLSFPIAMAAAAFFGFLVGVPCLRLKGDYLAIATLGFSQILINLIQNSEKLGQSLGMSFPNIVRISVSERRHFYFIYMAMAVLIVVVTLFV